MSIEGNTLEEFEWNGETKTLNLTYLPKGFYFVKISINSLVEVRKVVIQ